MPVRPALAKDIETIVDVHLQAFPHFFLSSLGPEFLACYYHSVMTAPDGLLLTSFDGDSGKVTAFCAATTLSRGFHRRLVKARFVTYVLISLRLLFTRPRALLRLAYNMSKTGDTDGDRQDYAELLSIASHPHAQKRGAGTALLTELKSELARRGCGVLSLTTDAEGNEATLAFYRKNGFDITNTFVAYPKRRMFRMATRLTT
ncbi:GNAT family N-acetyltransferase [Oligosphaera ethanolica]|uniref:Ribosomal protein S18 acetylase RimI-like enzyme n=1 Tax=Oligosphaera ethanolica TaxID=760260 RepID=A0AAE3VFY7_9BACT|nr:N-acetyltransferase [Oligosphaera ethanolica]MDQ0289867.1 ribosomal protein S18 acetylase RimI-like enzyme [Oligosphaera ethanolica]